jgi:electron transport complex protein RnfG
MAKHEPEALPEWRPLRAGAWLALLLALGAIGLVLLEETLRPALQRQERARQLRPMQEILPARTWDEDLLADPVLLTDRELLGTAEPVPVYRARRAGQTEAVLFAVTAPQGYGGEIRRLVAVDAQGRLLGVRALAHRETAGLGDMIETRRSDWIERFKGRSLADPPLTRWAIGAEGGDFDAWTGATVTSRAVVAAVRDALRLVERHRAELFGEPAAR